MQKKYPDKPCMVDKPATLALRVGKTVQGQPGLHDCHKRKGREEALTLRIILNNVKACKMFFWFKREFAKYSHK